MPYVYTCNCEGWHIIEYPQYTEFCAELAILLSEVVFLGQNMILYISPLNLCSYDFAAC